MLSKPCGPDSQERETNKKDRLIQEASDPLLSEMSGHRMVGTRPRVRKPANAAYAR